MNASISAKRLSGLLGSFDRDPAYDGLFRALQCLIGDGRVPGDARLPSERSLATELGLSRTTVARAYGNLIAAGFATARQGSGTHAKIPRDLRRVNDYALSPDIPNAVQAVDLNYAATAALPGGMQAYERALSRLPTYLGTNGYFSAGLPELRNEIAEGFNARGLPTVPRQVLITPGALPSIAMTALALKDMSDRIAVESPVYPNSVAALRLGGAGIVSSPLADPLGDSVWDFKSIDETLRQSSAKLCYTVPDFQNPTGHLMSDEERDHYAHLLRARKCVAIVDEILQPTRFADVSMPAPFAAHHADTITIGSASKIFWGGLRVGWIRAPLKYVEKLVSSRLNFDLSGSLFDQLVVIELLRTRDILTIRRKQLRRQRDSLANALRKHFPAWQFKLPQGGLTLWVKLPNGGATRYAAAMENHGIHLAPGPIFVVDGGGDDWLRIPYTLPEDQIVEAIRKLAQYSCSNGKLAHESGVFSDARRKSNDESPAHLTGH